LLVEHPEHPDATMQHNKTHVVFILICMNIACYGHCAGEFVGGSDICEQMMNSGELQTMLQAAAQGKK
jgi:hypothetical protein